MGVNDPHAPKLRRSKFPFAHADYFGALRFRGAIEPMSAPGCVCHGHFVDRQPTTQIGRATFDQTSAKQIFSIYDELETPELHNNFLNNCS